MKIKPETKYTAMGALLIGCGVACYRMAERAAIKSETHQEWVEAGTDDGAIAGE